MKADDGKTVLKPYPDTVLVILKEQQSIPKRTLIVGDSITDIMAGKKANIVTCYASYGIGKLENSVTPDYIINKFTDLLLYFN